MSTRNVKDEKNYGLSDEQKSQFKQAFNLFDTDKDGSITAEELGTVMRSLGQDPTEQEIQDMIDEVDEDGDGTIDFEEFLGMMAKKLKSSDSPEELLEAFKVFEYQDLKDYMPVSELRYVLENLAEELNGMEVEYIMNLADPRHTGHVAFDTVLKLVTPPYNFDPDVFPDPRPAATRREVPQEQEL